MLPYGSNNLIIFFGQLSNVLFYWELKISISLSLAENTFLLELICTLVITQVFLLFSKVSVEVCLTCGVGKGIYDVTNEQ